MPNTALFRVVAERPTPAFLDSDTTVQGFVEQLHARFGKQLSAVLMYGSYLRGKRDTVLDFYAILDTYTPALSPVAALANRALPPNVYTLTLQTETGEVRAKYATVTLHAFSQAMRRRYDCYFWARFTQPTVYVFVKNDASRTAVDTTLTHAVETFAANTLPMIASPFTAQDFWQGGLAQTYATELRAESPGSEDTLYTNYSAYLDNLLEALAKGPDIHHAGEGLYAHDKAAQRPQSIRRWRLRRVAGKLLSVARLVKAATTFNDGFAYLLWKIERHSGIYIAPSERQLRYPLLFAWPLLWRLYRLGAFR